jgi:hypothetical protein
LVYLSQNCCYFETQMMCGDSEGAVFGLMIEGLRLMGFRPEMIDDDSWKRCLDVSQYSATSVVECALDALEPADGISVEAGDSSQDGETLMCGEGAQIALETSGVKVCDGRIVDKQANSSVA